MVQGVDNGFSLSASGYLERDTKQDYGLPPDYMGDDEESDEEEDTEAE